MHNPNLQLMVYRKGIAETRPEVEGEGAVLKFVSKLESPNYLFLDLEIKPDAKPGSLTLRFFEKDGQSVSYPYQLRERSAGDMRQQGLNPGDVMYLIMPDRFANGDPSNDEIPGMFEKPNRSFHGGKHGGDLKGIRDHLDYLQDLGITTLWLNPVFENNMRRYSYHGYSITDHYKVDPRLGSLEDYESLVDECHNRNMKVVKDMIFNHIGLEHPWMQDLPSADWIHQWPEFTQTNYTNPTVTDPYISEFDLRQMVDGWFVRTMPDLNQKNPFLARYLIQNSIWWIEHTGIDGIRMDTYPYPDKQMMAQWVQEVRAAYPDFYIVGETWLEQPSYEGYWQGGGTPNKDGYDSHLPSISDFPVYFAARKAFGPEGELFELYKMLSQDFVYRDPFLNKIFLDNHDVDRFFAETGKDLVQYKLAMAFLLTTRGIPQIFYGTEILMAGTGDHGVIREDFPGGWEGDKRNAFTSEGRSDAENEAFDYVRKILQWRKDSRPIAEGQLKHYLPRDEVYVYERFTEDESVIVILNNSPNETILKPVERFKESFEKYTRATDLLTGEMVHSPWNMKLPAKSARILILRD
jgi:glycosidase